MIMRSTITQPDIICSDVTFTVLVEKIKCTKRIVHMQCSMDVGATAAGIHIAKALAPAQLEIDAVITTQTT